MGCAETVRYLNGFPGQFPVAASVPQCHLLSIDESSRSLTLYDTEGTYLSQCVLPDGKANGGGQSFVWIFGWAAHAIQIGAARSLPCSAFLSLYSGNQCIYEFVI